jgi:hypothetical protein
VASTAWDELHATMRAEPVSPPDLSGVPDPVRRYLTHALGDELRPAKGAILEMRGQIKLGRWLPFRARQLLAPRHGTVWEARVGWVISGCDRFVGDTGGMDWRLLGLVPVMRASGPDVGRSTAERAGAESVWVPGAVLPGTAAWHAHDETHLEARFSVGTHPVTVHHLIDGDGALRATWLDRWGDADGSGTFRRLPFGMEVDDERRFGDTTIPSSGRVGWHYGTDRWPEGEFFRFTVTRYEPVP